MEDKQDIHESQREDDSPRPAATDDVEMLRPLPIDKANKSEHVPPIIIKGSSFFIDCEDELGPPQGSANPPFTHRYPFPFIVRGIRVTANPFGTPETLYYHPDPVGCRINFRLRTQAGSLNFSIANVLVGVNRVIELTTHDHRLPAKMAIPDPHRPNRYPYAADDSIQLSEVSVVSATGVVLYQNDMTLPGFFVGIWRVH